MYHFNLLNATWKRQEDFLPRVKKRDAVLLSRYVKGVPFFNGRYTKGVPFLSKMVYKRVRGWTSGGSPPYKNLLSAPPGIRPYGTLPIFTILVGASRRFGLDASRWHSHQDTMVKNLPRGCPGIVCCREFVGVSVIRWGFYREVYEISPKARVVVCQASCLKPVQCLWPFRCLGIRWHCSWDH